MMNPIEISTSHHRSIEAVESNGDTNLHRLNKSQQGRFANLGQYLVLIPALSLLISTGCEQPPPPPAPPPPTVECATPIQRDVTQYFYYTGNLQSPEQVEIRARVPGYLASVDFEESTPVEKDALLLTIEKDSYKIAVGRAEAALARAEATLKLADTNLKRMQGLFAKEAATPLEMATEEAEFAQAEADVHAAKEELAAAELDLSYTDVRTPIA
ncbi:MAG: hypothetical protein ACPGXK_15570, partial [Phycisphaerae bacterium]